MMSEQRLIFELLRQAIRDADMPKYQFKAHAQRFIDSPVFGECCEFIGGNAPVIRRQLRDNRAAVLENLLRAPNRIVEDEE